MGPRDGLEGRKISSPPGFFFYLSNSRGQYRSKQRGNIKVACRALVHYGLKYIGVKVIKTILTYKENIWAL